MDQLFISAGLEQLLQFAILLFVVVGFFRQFATQRDIKKLDDRLVKLETGQTELKAGQTALEGRFEILDSNVRENGKKTDASLELHNAVRTEIQVLQASVNRLDSYFETPKLKSS